MRAAKALVVFDAPPKALVVPFGRLATQINDAHVACLEAGRTALNHAIRAGELLLEAKRRVGHGHFLDWIADHCRFSKRWAQEYMKLARHYGSGKANCTSYLTITEALAAIPTERAPRWLWAPMARRDILNFSAADRVRYHDLLRQFRSSAHPEIVVLKALGELAKLQGDANRSPVDDYLEARGGCSVVT
jgi:hypothetical protein